MIRHDAIITVPLVKKRRMRRANPPIPGPLLVSVAQTDYDALDKLGGHAEIKVSADSPANRAAWGRLMEKFHRLEDALPAWRARALRIVTAHPVMMPPIPNGAAVQCVEAGPSADRRQPLQRIAAACPLWMAEQGCWPNDATDFERVAAEIEAALRRLVAPSPAPETRTEIPGSTWAIAAAAGSAAGALILSPLTFLWFDNKPIGMFAGGTLGAYLVVTGIAMLLERPHLVSVLRSAVALSTGGMVIGGVWRAIRGASLGWGRSILWLLATPLVMGVLRPRRPSARAEASGGSAWGIADVTRAADIALAVAWSHPDRLAKAEIMRPREPTVPLPIPVLVALSGLQAELTRAGSDQDVRDASEELLQRLQEEGYAWVSVPPGTPYAPDMAALFDVFGTIPPGQPVRTRNAAMTKGGQVVQRGELRRA